MAEDILTNCEERGRFGLIALVEEVGSQSEPTSFLADADLRVWLESAGHPRLGVGFEPSCWRYKNGSAYIYVPFGSGDRRDLVEGVEYTAVARNEADYSTWELDLQVRR